MLADLLPTWLNAYNKDFDDNLTTSDITDWDMSKFVKPECGKAIYDYLTPKYGVSLWDDMNPIDGAVRAVDLLNNVMEIFVVSSVLGNYDICKFKEVWLQKYFSFLDKKKFYFVTDKSAVTGDFMVDDYYKNLEGFLGKRILFDRPHNRHIETGSGTEVVRAVDWQDVYTKILTEPFLQEREELT